MHNHYRPPTATQESLFPLEEIDIEIAERQIALIGMARTILEEERKSKISHRADRMNPIRRFFSKCFGELRELNEIYNKRSEGLDTLERSMSIAAEEGSYHPGYFETLGGAYGVKHLIRKAETISEDQ